MTQEDYNIVEELLHCTRVNQNLFNLVIDLKTRLKDRKWYPLENPLLETDPNITLIVSEIKKMIEELNFYGSTTENGGNLL
ncbi:hypothetical protein CAPN004_10160 [Capnocytophaga cynodegmi]|uniref:hypothetical protein n=1 Tax=Capnocytophaga cynodegmi TaxID=28189 RepID=UPI001AC1B7A9|nr:hypothetical protein [Capnocytophaga cynodegmi]GIM51986.1 hypothetical protein CAPN004_10160 [Capnocytophaga cynodegmi]